jgi:C-terminal processing protease CtpA/Prc
MIQQYDGGSEVPPGSEITSINGMPFNKIMKRMLPYISSDGYNHSLKIWRLNNDFPYLYSLIFGFRDDFDIEFKHSGKKNIITLPAVSRETIASYSKQEWGETWFDHNLKCSILEERNTAIMIIKTFSYYDDTKKFRSFLDDSFEKIHKNNIHNLILDLRDNDGGDPFCSTPLLAYLEPEPVPYFRERYGKYAHMADPIPLAKNPYKGNLFILINGGGYSTTGHFTSVLKYHHIGTFIGLETGGTYTCNDASKMINLKNTRFYVNCARATFVAAVRGLPDDRGIIPDVVVEPSVNDLITGRDPMMEAAFEIIDSLLMK